LILSGEGRNPPLMMGTTADEFDFMIMIEEIETEQEYESWVRTTYPEIADRVLAAYPAQAYGLPRLAAAAVQTDQFFICPTSSNLQALAGVNDQLYQYLFTYVPSPTRFLDVGSYHAAELYYLFNSFDDVIDYRKAVQVSRNTASLWTSFARDGVPAAGGITWPAFTAHEQQYLVIDSELSTGSQLRRDYCDLWSCCEQYQP
ncbi:carboxylesterase family protein, partial [Thermodesulfobacteriota bacterium]